MQTIALIENVAEVIFPLIENIVLLIAAFYAYRNRGYATYLVFMAVVVAYLTFDMMLLNTLDIKVSNYDNTIYYITTSMFFIVCFGIFLIRITGLSITFAVCMLVQAFMSFFAGINGMALNGASLPTYDIIYNIQRAVNSVVWAVEIYALLSVEIRTAGNAITAKIKING